MVKQLLHGGFFLATLCVIKLGPERIKGPVVDKADRAGDLLAAKSDLLGEMLVFKDLRVDLVYELFFHLRDGADGLIRKQQLHIF